MELSDLQREMARHSLGFDGRSKLSYRNHYVTSSMNGKEFNAWNDLVQRGLARRAEPSQLSGGGHIFWCTRELALAVRKPDEHLDHDFRE